MQFNNPTRSTILHLLRGSEDDQGIKIFDGLRLATWPSGLTWMSFANGSSSNPPSPLCRKLKKNKNWWTMKIRAVYSKYGSGRYRGWKDARNKIVTYLERAIKYIQQPYSLLYTHCVLIKIKNQNDACITCPLVKFQNHKFLDINKSKKNDRSNVSS